ncbi:TetR/AcrR family transcriptional regulator [Rhodoferax sp. PAMC 29310]|uniref:TetR/AcrR family transcriptional regulator n=1 Tax=Rhodoferax sp. PAMC 29310 TaxID=2822760 RepID=UPI001B31AF89|nr:TetR/AcrR family transcriptional regulator [Rhodoferax sp. PAMC 29310]
MNPSQTSDVGATRLPTEARQAEIIAAALQLAQDRSPGAITTAELAAAVGLSQGALFKHFDSKDAVWLAAMGWVSEQLLARLTRAAREANGPLDALQRVFVAHVAFCMLHPGVPRVVFHELQRPTDSAIKQRVREMLQTYRQLLLDLLQAAVDAGEAQPDLDAPAAATLFVGLIQGLVMQSMLSGQVAHMASSGSGVFQLFLRAIAPPL